MATTIDVDDEVLHALEARAIEEGLVFGTPNEVLRRVLEVDRPRSSQTVRIRDNPGAYRPLSETGRTHQRIGPRLLREHRELAAQKGYYSKTGVPYQRPDVFPAVFFDPSGYLVIPHEDWMRGNPFINVGRQVSVPGGIKSVPDYRTCPHSHDPTNTDQAGEVGPISQTLSSIQQLDTPRTDRRRLPSHRVTGGRLLREHKHIDQNLRAYADRDGIFYEWPKGFPAILFDDGGYVTFETEASMLNATKYLTAYPETHKISVRDGISSMRQYVRCDHSHSS